MRSRSCVAPQTTWAVADVVLESPLVAWEGPQGRAQLRLVEGVSAHRPVRRRGLCGVEEMGCG